jgi:aldehyde:ferredoxin oxidoreductase
MGIYGKTLNVDLTEKRHFLSPVQDRMLKTFLGGRGINVAYLFDRISEEIDPLGKDNCLLFSCGLLTGTAAPASSRLHINAVSPLTGLLGSSNIGGQAGSWLRACGLQSIIVRGRSNNPVYLYIEEGRAEIRDARFLKGLDTFQTQETIKDVLGNRQLTCLVIGPAGENLARFACIISGRDHAAGRTGMGAVMGSKNLKAIVISKGGKRKLPVKKSKTRDAVRQYVKKIKASPDFKTFAQYGGAGYVKWADDMGIMPTRNYQENRFPQVDSIDGRRLEAFKLKSSGCYNCPIQCKAVLSFDRKKDPKKTATRPEFEPMLNIGAKCGLDDLEAIVSLDNLCSRLGIDSTSAATTMAFAMDLYARGILTRKDTHGLDLTWGNAQVMETLITQMAFAEGFGALLSKGVRQAARVIGKGADQYAAHVKGLELSAYHPGSIMGTALGYAISSRGGDYNNVYASLEYRWSKEQASKRFGSPEAVDIHATRGKGKLIRRAVLVNIVLDSLGLCKVPVLSMIGTFDLKGEAELASALTGLTVTADALFAVGDRIASMERYFNLRQSPGMDRDSLPPMFMNQPGSNMSLETLDTMIKEYYTAMGWDEHGNPDPGLLKGTGE